MAIESAVMMRRFAWIACLAGSVGLLAGSAAVAQLPIQAPAPVTVGSTIPFHHGATGQWSQIYSMKLAPNGNILFLDSALSEIFQLAPGAAEPTLVVGPAPAGGSSNCSNLEPAGSFWNAAIAFDANNTLYVTDRYGSAVHFCRVPYNASTGTWQFTAATNWTGAPTITVKGVSTAVQPQDLTVGDDGTFYVSWSNTGEIDKFTVDANGNATNVTQIITGLEQFAASIAVDHAGNLFFVENIYGSTLATRVTGIREIPANSTLPLTGDATGSLESSLPRVDPTGAGFTGISGITVDAAGNLYFSSISNSSYGGNVSGVFMVPNEGTPKAPSLVWAHTVMVSPVYAGHAVMVDPRGLLWIPTGGSSNWVLPGTVAPTCDTTSTATVEATCLDSTIVVWKPGSANLGTSPVGTPGTPQTVYYIFSQATTPAKFAYVQPGSNNFTTLTANPNADPNTTPEVAPCTAGVTYPAFSSTETSNAQYSWCAVYLELNTNTAGVVEGELQMLDGSNAVIPGSDVFLYGVGQGPAVSLVSSAAMQSIASGLNTPLQVAADPLGNTYVADSALKAIEMYPAGTTSPISGKVIGTGLSAPTGVAVDGAGDLYIGDSGKVIEIPFVNGKLATAQQTTLMTGLGSHLNLAADAAGDVFVADKDKKQVVEISNPQTTLLQAGQPTLTLGANAGFTGPSAIATDNSGNVWVADGSNLWEIAMPFGLATEITSSLQAPVTGLAIDPSGSVFVSGAAGVIWIPHLASTGGLSINGAVLMAAGFGTSNAALPNGVALDGMQNAYVTYGSGATAGLAQLGIGGTINFNDYGEINPNVPFEADAQLFNLGNTPLTLAALSGDVPTGTNASYYSVVPATGNSPACGPSTSTAPGGSCYLGLSVQTPAAGQSSASVAVLSNAANAPTGVNIALAANAVTDYRPASSIALAVTPSSGIVYPGAAQVKVTVSSSAGTPSGTVILSVGSASGSLPKQTLTLNGSGVASYSYTNLLGGTYNVVATYTGNGTAGATLNTCSPASSACFAGSASKTTFTVTPAKPAFVVGPPGCPTASAQNCTLNPQYVTNWAGNTYVNVASQTSIVASVTSSVGTPTGTVSFQVNGSAVDPTQPYNALNSSGNATFSTQNLPIGVYTITAVYNGDVNFASQSVTLPVFEVIQPSVQVTATPASTTLTAGTPGQVTLNLMPLVGFNQQVYVECVQATLPPYAECTFDNPEVSVGANGATPTAVVVTISTNVPVNGGTASIARQAPWSLAGLFALGLLGLMAGRKRWNSYCALLGAALMFSGVFAGMSSCTNAGYSTPPAAPKVTTPAGTYQVQIITYNPLTQKQNSLTTPLFTLPTTVQ